MKSPICEKLNIEFPLIAFSHCRDVVVEVSKAGGMGVLGAAGFSSEQLEIELSWIDDHIDGRSYGVDLIVPNTMANKDESKNSTELGSMIPEEHRAFAGGILARNGIDTTDLYAGVEANNRGFLGEKSAKKILEVAFSHPLKLIVNALGVPPAHMLELSDKFGVSCGALIGNKQHAIKQAEAGVDVIICSGTEAGGHCGEISTMVLVPEITEALKDFQGVSVLAAGGIVTGRQMAAAMAMGAHGVWTGSVWLTTEEAETLPSIKKKLLSTQSNQTVRTRSRTGKFSRQVRSVWTDAWEENSAPDPLPMPLQSLVSEPALNKVGKLAELGNSQAQALNTYWVGQGVGLMNESASAKQVVYDFMEDFLSASDRLKSYTDS
ncbi:MAG: monooxygenase [Gammaproteobacteria bacterium]|nr:monooxygenase [Gammaproteobacteria bacterium]|tara:strand:- start:77 stop:1210 length:1134 start_codon:yes stop_codon:yes gene_type:complete